MRRIGVLAVGLVLLVGCGGDSGIPPEVLEAADQRLASELEKRGRDLRGSESDVECREAEQDVYSCLVQHRSKSQIAEGGDGFTSHIEVEHFPESGRTVTTYVGDV